jgi:hypothetical protein
MDGFINEKIKCNNPFITYTFLKEKRLGTITIIKNKGRFSDTSLDRWWGHNYGMTNRRNTTKAKRPRKGTLLEKLRAGRKDVIKIVLPRL